MRVLLERTERAERYSGEWEKRNGSGEALRVFCSARGARGAAMAMDGSL